MAGTDHLTANFAANNVGGRIEGGYRFAIPGVLGWPGQFGFTPYAAGQVQVFRTPFYMERAASGSPVFALAYNASTTTTSRLSCAYITALRDACYTMCAVRRLLRMRDTCWSAVESRGTKWRTKSPSSTAMGTPSL